jgi:hypothetical protein
LLVKAKKVAPGSAAALLQEADQLTLSPSLPSTRLENLEGDSELHWN